MGLMDFLFGKKDGASQQEPGRVRPGQQQAQEGAGFPARCQACGGQGTLTCQRCGGMGSFEGFCDSCKGSGSDGYGGQCQSCHGTGKGQVSCGACSGGAAPQKCQNCLGTGYEGGRYPE